MAIFKSLLTSLLLSLFLLGFAESSDPLVSESTRISKLCAYSHHRMKFQTLGSLVWLQVIENMVEENSFNDKKIGDDHNLLLHLRIITILFLFKFYVCDIVAYVYGLIRLR